MLTKETAMRALSKAMHPEIDYSLVKLGMIKNVSVEQHRVIVTLNLPFAGVPIKDHLVRIITEAVTNNEDQDLQVEVRTVTMNEQDREEFTKRAREKWKL